MIDSLTAKDMSEHGCNSLSCWPDCKPWIDNKINFASWDEYFKMLKNNKLDYAFIWFIGTKNDGNIVEKSCGKNAIDEMLKGINERVSSGAYPNNFFITLDEACQNGEVMNALKQLFEFMKQNTPALKRFGVSLDRNSYAIQHKGIIDVLSCNGDFVKNSAWCKEQKIKMYTYTVFSARTTSANARYNSGFNPWRYGANGTYGWALKWYNGHPFNDLDGNGISDWGIILPNWCGKPISSPAWEGWREGWDDLRYLAVYEELVKKGKADAKLLQEIKDFLKEFKESKEVVVGDSVFEATLDSANKLIITREKLIKAILAANKSK